jgi:hypothetical protein
MVQSQLACHQAVLFVYEPDSFVPRATLQQGRTFWYHCDQIDAPLELTGVHRRIVGGRITRCGERRGFGRRRRRARMGDL